MKKIKVNRNSFIKINKEEENIDYQKWIKNLEFVVDREKRNISLFWNYAKDAPITEIQIYKNKKGAKPSLWKVLSGKQLQILDKEVEINTTYEYYFVPSLSGNKPSKGERVEVVF